MAGKRDSLADMLSCQVCFEDFEESGSHIPRIFPCSHTVCESCVKDLISNDTIVCPECRKKHRAKNKEVSFSQNQYLLACMQDRRNSKHNENKKCKQHGKQQVLYCMEKMCQKAICMSCLKVDHNKHDLIDIKEQEKEVLTREVREIIKNMEANLNIISNAMKDASDKTEKCVKELKRTKEEVMKHFDEMIDEAEIGSKENSKRVEKDVSAMKANLEVLNGIQRDLEGVNEINREQIDNKHEIAREIAQKNRESICGAKSLQYSNFTPGQISTAEISGHITRGEITVVLPDCEGFEAKVLAQALPTQITSATQLKCTVTQTINSGITSICSITLLGEKMAVVSGKVGDIHKIESYDVTAGVELQCLNLDKSFGVAEVSLGGRLALAVSYSSEQKIEFRDPNDLSRILHTHLVTPHRPFTLCTAATPSRLLYMNWKYPREVHWLDLTERQPKPATDKRVVQGQQGIIYEMCLAQDGDKQLLIVAAVKDGIFAYNTDRNKLEWKVDVKPLGMERKMAASGISTDECGHLFVCDSFNGNRCVQMFSTSDGQYLGCLMKDEKTFGDPYRIRWCEKTSSLLCMCWLKDKWCLKVLKVQYDG